MSKIKRSILIDAPVEKVFDYISDYQNWPNFYIGISDVRPQTEHTAQTGSKFIYRSSMGSISFTVGTEFRDFVKNKGWRGKSFKGVNHATNYELQEVEGKTRFTHEISFNIPFYLGGKIFDQFFMKSAFEKIVEGSLQNVKNQLEST